MQLGSARLQAVAARKRITSLTEDGGALSTLANNFGILPISDALSAATSFARDTSPNWFAAYTTPRHEKAVLRQLEMRHLESFLPLYSSVSRWKNGCRVVIDRPLFPNYVFVHVRRRESVKVLQVPGVISIVSAGREPAALPYSEIESLRAGLQRHRCEPHPYLLAGQRVRITAGSLAGMIGVLVRNKNQNRVVLTLDLIRQSVSVEVDANEIEALKQ